MPTLAIPHPASTLSPAPRRAAPATATGLGFFLFLLVNLALFVRPSDVVPQLAGVEFYFYLIVACFLVSFLDVLPCFSPERLDRSPVDVFVLAWLPIIVVSHLVHSQVEQAWEDGFAYFKIIVYYLLLVSLVTTPRRLKTFTSCLILCTLLTTIVSMLDFFKVIQLPRPDPGLFVRFRIDETRMYGPGIFADPNDVSVIISAAVLLVLGKLADKGNHWRFLWVLVLPVFGAGFYLAQSRGGLLALAAGLGIMIRLKWGWSRAFLIGAVALPLAALLLAGRLTNISSQAETGQGRIQLWSEGLVMLRANPVFGVGMNGYADQAGQVAHNSFLQAYGDTGMVGGTIYFSMIVLALWGLYRHVLPAFFVRNAPTPTIVDPDYRQIHPFLTGALVVCAAGMMTLTMNTLVTTYTFLGMASVFVERARTYPARSPIKVDVNLVVVMGALSVAFVIGMFVFVRLTFRL